MQACDIWEMVFLYARDGLGLCVLFVCARINKNRKFLILIFRLNFYALLNGAIGFLIFTILGA